MPEKERASTLEDGEWEACTLLCWVVQERRVGWPWLGLGTWDPDSCGGQAGTWPQKWHWDPSPLFPICHLLRLYKRRVPCPKKVSSLIKLLRVACTRMPLITLAGLSYWWCQRRFQQWRGQMILYCLSVTFFCIINGSKRQKSKKKRRNYPLYKAKGLFGGHFDLALALTGSNLSLGMQTQVNYKWVFCVPGLLLCDTGVTPVL